MPDSRAFWTIAPNEGEIRSAALPTPDSTNVLVEASYSAISRGTEALVFSGRVPVSEYQRMRAPFQEGEFPAPIKYGYASVGRIVAGAPHRIGERVFVLYPHQDRYIVPETAALPVPEHVPSLRATLAANMETALNAVWDACPKPGDAVTIVGAGVLGCLIASILSRYPELDVELVDVLPERRTLAENFDVAFSLPSSANTQRDIVMHTSASSAGLARALELSRPEGQVIELSWYGDAMISVPLGGAFHSGRLKLISSQVGRVSPNKPGWNHGRRLALALRLLDDSRVDALFRPAVAFSELPKLMPEILGAVEPNKPPAIAISYAKA